MTPDQFGQLIKTLNSIGMVLSWIALGIGLLLFKDMGGKK